jgi:hypothetical protein
LTVGCGREGLERVVVGGNVTYQGEPVAVGKIRFFPAEDTMAPMSGAFIVDGKYEARTKGGVPVGSHTVEIVAHRVDPKYAHLEGNTSPDTDGALPLQQYLPAKYNKQTELTLTVPSGSSRITKDFELTD